MAEHFPYGMWHSIVSARWAAAVPRLGPTAIGPDGAAWWEEIRPDEGGRAHLMRAVAGGSVTEVPAEWGRPAAEQVGSWLVVRDGMVASGGDGRLYLFRPGERPRPLVPEPVGSLGDYFTDLVLAPDEREVWGVRVSRHDGMTIQSLVAVPLDGSQEVATLLWTTRCVSSLRPSPDGSWVAWIAWEPPLMPWDGAELRIGRVMSSGVAQERRLLGGPAEAVCQPHWASAHSLYAISDRSGWWNPYEVGVDGGLRALCPWAEEFAWPRAGGGPSTYGTLQDGRLAVLHGTTRQRLDLLVPEDGTLVPLDLPYDSWRPTLSAGGRLIVGVAGTPRCPASVVVVDAVGRRHCVLRRSIPDPPLKYAPQGELTTFTGRDGHVVHAIVHAPYNPHFQGPAGERVPYVLMLHDGPVTHVTPMFDPITMFFTSRGLGVAEICPRGSAGFGRAYREQVFGQWGVADVEDCAVVVRGLTEHWNADPARLVLRGVGAGASTALGVLAGTDLCVAATVYAPVTDLQSATSTSRYLRQLAADSALLRPAAWLERIRRPVLMFHGLRDGAVPAAQTTDLRDVLRRHHVPHACITFADETHDFHHADTIERALEAELSFYGQMLGFDPPGTRRLALQDPVAAARTGLGWPT